MAGGIHAGRRGGSLRIVDLDGQATREVERTNPATGAVEKLQIRPGYIPVPDGVVGPIQLVDLRRWGLG